MMRWIKPVLLLLLLIIALSSKAQSFYFLDSTLNSLIDQTSRVHCKRLDMIPVYDCELNSIEKNIEKIRFLNFIVIPFSQLNTFYADNSFDLLVSNAGKKRSAIDRSISKIDKLYYTTGNIFFVKGRIPLAIYYYNKSILFNPLYAPSLYQLSYYYYLIRDVDTSLYFIQTALNKAHLTDQQKNRFSLLCDTLINYITKKGASLIKDENYNEAIALLSKANLFCDSTRYVACPPSIIYQLKKAKNGLLQSYLRVAKKALDNEKLSLAEFYLSKAKEYQSENIAYLPSEEDVDNLTFRLVKTYINKGNSYKNRQQIPLAETFYRKALSLFDSSNLTTNNQLCIAISSTRSYFENNETTASINRTTDNPNKNTEGYLIEEQKEDIIKNKLVYSSLLQLAEQLISSHQYENALQQLERAIALEKAYNIPRNTKLEELLNMSIKTLLHENIEAAQYELWKNEIPTAQELLNNIANKQNEYALTGDQEINSALIAMQEKIAKAVCENMQNQFDSLFTKASRLLELDNFMFGGQILQQAIELSKENPHCAITNDSALKLLILFQPVITYQKLLLSADAPLQKNDYSMFFIIYLNAENYFNRFSIVNYGLHHTPLTNYIAMQNNSEMLHSYQTFLLSNNRYADALDFLQQLHKRYFPLKQIKNFQIQVGIKLAEKDAKRDYFTTPERQIIEYTKNDPWLNYLKKSYLRKTKHLNSTVYKFIHK